MKAQPCPRLQITGSPRRSRKPYNILGPVSPRKPDQRRFASWQALRSAGYSRRELEQGIQRAALSDWDLMHDGAQLRRGGVEIGQRAWFSVRSAIYEMRSEKQRERDLAAGMCGGSDTNLI